MGDIRMAADSTMLRMVNLLIALSLGVHREQLEHRMGLTWPRPFLLRPLLVTGSVFALQQAGCWKLCGLVEMVSGQWDGSRGFDGTYLDALFLTMIAV